LVCILSPRRWVVVSVNGGSAIVSVRFVKEQSAFVHMRGNDAATARFVMFGQSEVDAPRSALMSRAEAAEIAAAEMQRGGAMVDVDRWVELDLW